MATQGWQERSHRMLSTRIGCTAYVEFPAMRYTFTAVEGEGVKVDEDEIGHGPENYHISRRLAEYDIHDLSRAIRRAQPRI